MIHALVSNIHHLLQLISKDSPPYDYIMLNDYCYNQVIKHSCDLQVYMPYLLFARKYSQLLLATIVELCMHQRLLEP